MDNVELIVVYDNYPVHEGLRTAHGFACVVRADDWGVLFDTGGSGQILLGNMDELEIDLADIQAVVLSHMHWDHIGGLDAVLGVNPEVTVYAPAGFSSTFLRDVRRRAGAVVETEQARQINGSVWTTRVLERALVEQALYVQSAEGIVVVTGCAHPGVVELARAAKSASGQETHAVLGGFHMARMSQSEIQHVIHGLEDLGVQRTGPCHCSGDAAREAMQKAYGESYLDIRVGHG